MTATLEQEQNRLLENVKNFPTLLPGHREVQHEQFQGLCNLIERARELFKDSKAIPELHFDGLTFYVEVLFENQFLPPLSLQNCTFQGGCKFDRTTFVGAVVFNGSQFYRHTDIVHCDFNGMMSAVGGKFYGILDCDHSNFHGDARFQGVEFQSGAVFAGCAFKESSNFQGCKFSGPAIFSLSQFADASFNGVEFKEPTSFAGARFGPYAPRFHGATLHRDTSFAGASFDAFDHEQDWRAYRTLKQMMAAVRAQEEESFFFAHEQRARRKFHLEFKTGLGDLAKLNPTTVVAPSMANTWISVLYDYISNYGQNIVRPFLWWVLQCLVFAYLYLWQTDHLTTSARWLKESTAGEPARAIFLSLQSSLNPFAIFVKEPLVGVTSISLLLITLLQAVLSISLIALALLAIRRRFHKGSE